MSDNEFSLHLQEKFDALKKSSGSTGSVGAVSLQRAIKGSEFFLYSKN